MLTLPLAAALFLSSEPTPTPTPPATNGLWSVLWGVLGFLLVIVLAYFSVRWMAGRSFAGARAQHMKVVDRMVVSRDVSIALIEVGGKILAVSVSKDAVRLLTELDPAALGDEGRQASAAAKTGDTAENSTFLRRFTHNLAVFAGFAPKETLMRPPSPQGSAGSSLSFKSVLEQQTAEQADPVPEPEAPNAPPQARTEPIPAPPARDYSAAIEQMRRFGDVDQRGRDYTHTPTSGAAARQERPAPPPPRPAPEPQPPEHGAAHGELDDLSDRIAQRRDRMRGK